MKLLVVARTPYGETAWISWAKFFAIAAVVALHIFGATAVSVSAGSSGLGDVAIYVYKTSLFAVPIFVMVSGALILDPQKYRGPADFYRRRALRLVPALIVWHVFYFLFQVYVLRWPTSVVDFLGNALDGRAFTALYYFWIILGLTLLAPILLPCVNGQSELGGFQRTSPTRFSSRN